MCAIVKKSISNTCIWSVGNMCAWQWSVQVTHNWCCTARRERRWIGGSADRRIGVYVDVCLLRSAEFGVRSRVRTPAPLLPRLLRSFLFAFAFAFAFAFKRTKTMRRHLRILPSFIACVCCDRRKLLLSVLWF